MPLLSAETYFNITLSFRTVQENTVLFRRGSPRLMLILELSGGRLLLSLKSDLDPYSSSWTLTLPQNVSDGDWHTVESMFGKDTLLLRLLETCQGGNHCSKVARIEVGLELDTALETTIFGGLDAGEGSDSFIGCMRDLFVDSQLMVLEEWWHNLAVNITLGCNHQDRCLSGPCENQGECVNLWQGYRCKCRQPFEGPTCAEEYVTARFGLEDSASYAIFSIGERLESEGLSVSVFLRTRKESGLLVLLSNSTMVYFGLWLEKGKLKLQVNSLKSTSVRSSVNDGEIHFVSITIKENEVTLQESGREFKLTDIQPVSVRLGDKVHVGGLDDRQQTFAFGGYFKGCLQDLRLNDGKLQFFPLSGSEILYKPEVMVDVNPGCTSDYSCSKNPCQNGGLCFSAWDDFTCNCPPNTAGRRCEEVSWCGLNPCPPRAACRALIGGYECISNVTFQDNGSLIYRWNGLITRPLTSIVFSIRTRQRNAVVLHAESGSDFVTVSIQNDFLVLELLSGPSLSASSPLSPVTIHSSKPISDGQWHVVELLMADPWANTSQWIMLQSDEMDKPVVSVSVAGNLDFLREDVDVLLGGLGPESGLNLIGCLSNIEIGGLVLPYYGSDELRFPQNLDEKFEKISKVPIQVGCVDRPVCEPNPCLNGGVCEDLFNLLECFCPPGWVGNFCEVNVNSCASNPCRYGNCSEEGLAYSCTCDSSYTGVNCEVKVDECSGHKCANGGTCLRGVGSFSCLCPDKFTGQNCSVRIQEAPWYVVRNVPPKLPVSICGDEKYNYTCFNGGNCSETSMMCDCHPGFLGHWCELDHDECKSNPCLNGGYCHNLVNKFQCVCEMTFAGDICEIDLNAESVTSNLLLSISLVSAVLLLGLFVVATTLVITLTRRATRGTYSPSRQEKEGSRVEMWNIVQPPPMERLI